MHNKRNKKFRKGNRCTTANAATGGIFRRKRFLMNMDSAGDLEDPFNNAERRDQVRYSDNQH